MPTNGEIVKVCGKPAKNRTVKQTVDVPEITLKNIKKALFKQKHLSEYKLLFPLEISDVAEENKALYKMQIPDYFGGTYTSSESDSNRVKEILAKDLQPGDIFVWQEGLTSPAMVAVHNGDELVYAEGGKLVSLDQADLDRMYIFRFFIALRPSQAQ